MRNELDWMSSCHRHPERRISSRDLMGCDRLCDECLAAAENSGAAIADATWHLQPHERGVGRTYRVARFENMHGQARYEQEEV